MTRRRASSEQAIQHAIVQHLRQRGAPNLVFFHPANGGKRRPIEAAIANGLDEAISILETWGVLRGRAS